jgi:predicted ester cyclase
MRPELLTWREARRLQWQHEIAFWSYSRRVRRRSRTNVAFGGKVGFREYGEGWARAFPDGKIELLNLVAQGDLVVGEFTGRGTHTGVLKDPTGEIPATGRRVEMSFVEVYRVRNGKISEGRLYFDTGTVMAQLGISPGATTTQTQQLPAPASQPRH